MLKLIHKNDLNPVYYNDIFNYLHYAFGIKCTKASIELIGDVWHIEYTENK